jgi:hypothetical protein
MQLKHREADEVLPTSLLSKLFDATGTSDGGGRGFCMFVVDKDGEVCFIQKCEHEFVRRALMQTMETMVMGSEG